MVRHLLAAVVAATVLTGCAVGGAPESVAGTPGPAGPIADQIPSAELRAVMQEVAQVAPALEQHVRGSAYPRTVAEAEAALADAGLELTADHAVGAFVHDPDRIEFELCIEHTTGAWAAYDTAPMSTRDWGEDGGCPEL